MQAKTAEDKDGIDKSAIDVSNDSDSGNMLQ